MNRPTTVCLFGLLLVLADPASAQHYRDGYPETLSSDLPTATSAAAVYDTAGIQRNYEASGQPSVLVMLGRTLGSATSEWQADQRDVTSNLQQSFQGGASSTTRQTGVRQSEDRQAISVNLTDALQRFHTGFEWLFGRVGIHTLHYDTAVRRAQQENELQGRLSREGDLRKNETDAVLSYAELMLEIVSLGTTSIEGVPVESFQARLTRIDTNEIIAQYTTQPHEAAIVEDSWQGGDNGYEQVTEVHLRYRELGQEVAYRMFSQTFGQSLNVTPGSRRMQPAQPAANPNRPRPPRRNGGGQ